MRYVVTSLSGLTLFLLVSMLALSGCDSIIEETEPSTAISQEVALSSPDAIRGVRASMFDRLHATDLTTDWLLGPSSLADNTLWRGNQQRHQELNLNELRDGIGTDAYGNLYDLINDANILITGIDDGALPEGERAKLQAEGLFMRALALHHAVRIFGYDPDGQGGVISPASGPGSGFDLGVEIRTTPTLDVADATPLERSPVSAVYEQIIGDLTQAGDLFQGLPGDQQEGSEFFPSEAAVQALLARVYLYQRNWPAADEAAQTALDLAASSFGSGLATADSASLRSIFDERNGNPEAIFTVDTNPETESVGINDAISAYTTIQWQAQLPTDDLVDLYDAADPRLAAWYDPCFDEANNEVKEGCSTINEPGFELTKYSSEQGVSRYADDYIHLRVAEMYLIQAEARLNESGVGAGIGRLNDLRAARGLADLVPGDFTFDSAYDEILDERRRELVAEGHRFFDLKRLGRDIRKVRGLDGRGRDDLPFNSFRILDDFPPAELEVNTLLRQNPGY
jgi:hypothetical protein